MPFTLITGEFVPEAGRPDGDSIRFRPEQPDLVFKLRRRRVPPKINQNNGTVQLRFEGIDTLESRANSTYAIPATDSNLALCGVPDGKGIARGYILSNQIGPNGRPIAFVYAGEPDDADGSEIFLEPEQMRASVNVAQLERGHAYPLFYDTLFADLRCALVDAVSGARDGGKGIWAEDATQTGALWRGYDGIGDMPPIFPKLWRRLESYGRDPDISDPSSLDEFRDYVKFVHPERVLILPEARSTGLDNLIRTTGDTIRLDYRPEDLVIMSD